RWRLRPTRGQGPRARSVARDSRLQLDDVEGHEGRGRHDRSRLVQVLAGVFGIAALDVDAGIAEATLVAVDLAGEEGRSADFCTDPAIEWRSGGEVGGCGSPDGRGVIRGRGARLAGEERSAGRVGVVLEDAAAE